MVPHHIKKINTYVVVFYIVDGNTIKSVPIKNITKGELLQAYKEIYEYLQTWGFQPKLHKLDNETS